MTYYAGLDVSMKETTIAIVDEKGNFLFETICPTDPTAIKETLEILTFPRKNRLESGCLSFWLIEELKNLGFAAICIELDRWLQSLP